MEFDEFQKLSDRRCSEAFPECDDWDARDWAMAVAGEAGELCNLLKKVRRGDLSLEDRDTRRRLLSELADVITYSDLMITRTFNARTEDVILEKFYEVSRRVGWLETRKKPQNHA